MIVEIDTVLDRANKFLKENISKEYKNDFEAIRTFLFMNLKYLKDSLIKNGAVYMYQMSQMY